MTSDLSAVKDIVVGRRLTDGRAVIADRITEFLEHLCHTVLFNYGGYTREDFVTVPYHSILVQKCKDEEACKYIEYSLRSIRRWILYSKLHKFLAGVVTKNGCVFRKVLVTFYDAYYTGCKRIDNIAEQLEELSGHLQQGLINLQCDSGVSCDQPSRFFIQVKLLPDTRIKKHRPWESSWEEVKKKPDHHEVLPVGFVVDTKVANLSCAVMSCEDVESSDTSDFSFSNDEAVCDEIVEPAEKRTKSEF